MRSELLRGVDYSGYSSFDRSHFFRYHPLILMGNLYVRTVPLSLDALETSLDLHKVDGAWTCKPSNRSLDQVYLRRRERDREKERELLTVHD